MGIQMTFGRRIARVFPTKTKMSPIDSDAYFGEPDLFTPNYDEVHISVTFTWDIERGKKLADAWKRLGVVCIGGPAFDASGGDFIAGRYLRPGITITSRGCPNNCGFCFVPKREGKLRELPIVQGNIVQDNNLTACSRGHIDNVFKMLSTQKQVYFMGGLESARIDDYFVDKLRSIKIGDWGISLAYDTPNADKPLVKAVEKLNKYFKRRKIKCYVLIGYGDDTIEKAENRLRRAWEIGTLPFAMLYKPKEYNKDWKQLQRRWVRPAIIKSINQK